MRDFLKLPHCPALSKAHFVNIRFAAGLFRAWAVVGRARATLAEKSRGEPGNLAVRRHFRAESDRPVRDDLAVC